MPARALLPVVVLVIAGAVAAPAQEQPVPEPYDPAEFSPPLRHLRRAEIVAVGAFPFALLASTIVYDYARWAGAGFSQTLAPFGRALDEDPFADDEKVGIALAAVGVAVALAVADYLLGQAAEEPRYATRAVATPIGVARREYPSAPVTAPHLGLLPPSLATLGQRPASSPPAAAGSAARAVSAAANEHG